MSWLEKIQAPKFYRFIYYKSYKLFSKVSDDAPLAAEYVLFITLLFQLVFLIGLMSIVSGVNLWGEYITGHNKAVAIFFIALFLGMVYLLFVYKKKWKRIVEEFDKKNGKNNRGVGYLFLYIVGSIGLFALGVWFLTFNNPNYI
ncbi:hypothetical protein [Sinomicrobium weinanense]|uniref:Uncharacterized protein n=1 Tax=Sinomicrobium weinanense TaxID=2842200 RepID=A0A926JPV0_9FLAO|nr:hypothetical protein [Sinomicrobium weinanense]MBC9795275.1 hypothetical protein [Sinomicrobium weinanense]MBU3125747.1 hypothetical protein [Sinomicrobium weinanense]